MSLGVSVVIPLYNAADYIGETLDSVAAQTTPPAEVIVVDDGSSDDGATVAAGHRLRPRVIQQPNGGPAKARNTAIAASSAELIAFLDSDDLWQPNKLQVQLEAFQRHPQVGLVFAHAERFDDSGRVWRAQPEPRKTRLRDFLIANQASNLTALIPRRVYDDVGPLDERRALMGIEDYQYWLRILLGYDAHYICQNLASYRVRGNSLVGGEWPQNVRMGTRCVGDFLLDHPELSRQLFHMSPQVFLRWRVARQLAGSLGSKNVDWSDRRKVLGQLLTARPERLAG